MSWTRKLMIGFTSGALAHLIFQGGIGAVLFAAGLAREPVWGWAPVGPLAVPQTINNMFWDGLWGMIYVPLYQVLTKRLGLLGGGALFGLLPALVFWFVVLPLKGQGIGGGFEPAMVIRTLGLDVVFGTGTAFLYQFLAGKPGPREYA